MIKIPIKNGNIDAALEQFNAAKKEQSRKFDEQVANFFAPKADADVAQNPALRAPKAVPRAPSAPSYQSILSRSRRMG